MPFYEGQGLHDATWRYRFGGNIYRGNGSHGCVNLPLWAAAEIYEAVETGTAIIIFYE
jgi:lipoprotein-anchoring transpeptidase ErfK/SrfK